MITPTSAQAVLQGELRPQLGKPNSLRLGPKATHQYPRLAGIPLDGVRRGNDSQSVHTCIYTTPLCGPLPDAVAPRGSSWDIPLL